MWLVNVADQCSVNRSGAHFLQQHLGKYLLLLPDPHHRVWNDLTVAARDSSAGLRKTAADDSGLQPQPQPL
eukprot:7658731-Prorocentrum_lima.AAC.1